MATMTAASTPAWATEKPTALLVLADGTVIEGRGLGATGSAVAEVCFNTALTGYQEILTDPSYAGQIVTFTFPHIGNIGTNDEDIEDLNPAARAGAVGAVFKADVTNPSNYRAGAGLDLRQAVRVEAYDDGAMSGQELAEHRCSQSEGVEGDTVGNAEGEGRDGDALCQRRRRIALEARHADSLHEA